MIYEMTERSGRVSTVEKMMRHVPASSSSKVLPHSAYHSSIRSLHLRFDGR